MAIVAALASDAELLILDEPTSGLDPLMEAVFTEVISEAKTRGASVLLSSHILVEVETLADRVSIIRDGKVVETGTLAELRGHARTIIHATLARMPTEAQLQSLHEVELDGSKLTASADADKIGDAMALLTPFGLESLRVEPPSLESLFLRLYEREPEVHSHGGGNAGDGLRDSDNASDTTYGAKHGRSGTS